MMSVADRCGRNKLRRYRVASVQTVYFEFRIHVSSIMHFSCLDTSRRVRLETSLMAA